MRNGRGAGRGGVVDAGRAEDNVGLGRPSEVRLIFDLRIHSNTKGTFRTRVVTRGVDVCLDVNYRDSRIKEYLKEGRALRIETVVNSPDDLGVKRRLRNLDELQAKARAANTRLLAVQKAGQDCALSAPLFERVALPSLQEGQRVPALRFGDPRVMALAGALCVLVHTAVGFSAQLSMKPFVRPPAPVQCIEQKICSPMTMPRLNTTAPHVGQTGARARMAQAKLSKVWVVPSALTIWNAPSQSW